MESSHTEILLRKDTFIIIIIKMLLVAGSWAGAVCFQGGGLHTSDLEPKCEDHSLRRAP